MTLGHFILGSSILEFINYKKVDPAGTWRYYLLFASYNMQNMLPLSFSSILFFKNSLHVYNVQHTTQPQLPPTNLQLSVP